MQTDEMRLFFSRQLKLKLFLLTYYIIILGNVQIVEFKNYIIKIVTLSMLRSEIHNINLNNIAKHLVKTKN